MAKLDKIDSNLIKETIKKSKSWENVCTNLGLCNNSYNNKWLKSFVERENLNVSHFIKRLTKRQYELNPKMCKNCGKIIPWKHRENEYCSSSCAAQITNLGQRRVHSNRFCKNCGKELLSSQKKYCSVDCQQEFEQKEYIQRWKDGLETGLSGKYGISERLRRYFFDKYNCKCQNCGWGEENPITHKIPLQLHHIDGDCTNNREENLKLLCPNCHALTENFGSLNKNATRIDNRKRY